MRFLDPRSWQDRACVGTRQAATDCYDPKALLEVSEDLADAMKGLAVSGLDGAHLLQTRV
jgi:pyridoxal biosynthesis lyase PdxS